MNGKTFLIITELPILRFLNLVVFIAALFSIKWIFLKVITIRSIRPTKVGLGRRYAAPMSSTLCS